MGKTSIEWCTDVWNPVTGCSKVSQGCKFCYAERVFPRAYGQNRIFYSGPGSESRQRKFTDIVLHHDRLDDPLRWRTPRRVFVNSMSDLFHEAVTDEFIDTVFAVMADAGQHTFQILTKRPERMLRYLSPDNPRYSARKVFDLTKGPGGKFDCDMHWPLSNVWLGVSVEDQTTADERIPLLLQTPAAKRFISYEPALGPVDLLPWLVEKTGCANCGDGSWPAARCCDEPVIVTTPSIDWVISGGESGPKARPSHPDWFRALRDQCAAADVPYFHKQNGEWTTAVDRDRDDPDWRAEYTLADRDPEHYRILNLAGGFGFSGERVHLMKRVGKRAAGRLLDGRVHEEFPQ